MRVLMSETSWDAALLHVKLREQGLFITRAKTGEDLFESLNLLGRPVVILETGLPDMDWLKALGRLRQQSRNMSIFVLDRERSLFNQCSALAQGADDVLSPGMSGAEIAARIRAVMARRSGHASPNVTIGPMRLRMAERRAYWGPQRIELTQSQYNIFETICLGAPYSISRHVIMAELYGTEENGTPETINVFISHIRNRLSAAGAPRNAIETVAGRGYRLSDFKPSEGFLPVPDLLRRQQATSAADSFLAA